MKGIGILLVVLYHSMGKTTDALVTYDNGLFNVIASFFMQMFILISGYLVYKKIGNWEWTRRHILKWIVPITIFTILYWVSGWVLPGVSQLHSIYDSSFMNYIIHSVVSGFSRLVVWYLWCLVLCYGLAWIMENMRLKLNKTPFTLLWLGILVVINLIPFNIFGLFTLKWYGVYFIVGYAIHYYVDTYDYRAYRLIKNMVYISLVLFPLCIYLFDYMIPYQDADYGTIGLAVIYPALTHGQGKLIVAMLLMAFSGTGFVYCISKMIRWKYLTKPLVYLGSTSIGIYLIHVMFVGMVDNYLLSALIALIISLALYELLRHVKVANKLLFGGSML